MLRMDGFAYHHAGSPQEAVDLYARLQGARYIAGGTDILVSAPSLIVPGGDR